MLPFEDSKSLSLLFHLNSEPWANVDAYQTATYEVEYKRVTCFSPTIALPIPPETELLRVLRKRWSCRAYERRTLTLSQLSTLLLG
ncbi:MAG: hypothetical protein WA254_21240, partial [Candidatus Sulfotelmatobacter sp.]